MSGEGERPARPSTIIEFELSESPGLGPVELEILCGAPEAGEPGERLGCWRFSGARGGSASLEIDWSAPAGEMARLATSGSECETDEFEVDGERVVRPRMTARVTRGGKTVEFPVQVTDTAALARYYGEESHQDEYVVQHPFFNSFHEARLRTMERTFRKYIPPGSRVLDVGSGYSIFFLITTDWDHDLTCADLDASAMEKMRGLVPQWRWVVADALALPWEDSSFDAVYAGEIIEHVPDARKALSEWRRVLAAGGTLILTTPNRDRLLSRANRVPVPVHPEHIREMNLPEARAAATEAGFEVVSVTGIYLELALNWYRPRGARVDMLVSLAGSARHAPLYKPFMWLGKLVPSRAYDLVLVCRKK